MSGDVIRIAVSIGLAIAATLGAIAIFRREAAMLPEVMREEPPASFTRRSYRNHLRKHLHPVLLRNDLQVLLNLLL